MTLRGRKEIDSFGSREVPPDAMYGVATVRGQENFDISSRKLNSAPELVNALARIKRAAAAANREVGSIDERTAGAIIAASREVEEGGFLDHFVIDLLEGSGGTSINMNINEVIANRAMQLLGNMPGMHATVHPNDHVNRGQSTNDVLPSAIKLAVHEKLRPLTDNLTQLAESFEERSAAFDDVLRIGRTCMQAAQPMLLGQAFGGYAAAIRRLIEKILHVRQEMLVLPLGGTAIGTGLGSAAGYRRAVYRHLTEIVGTQISPAPNFFDAMQNADSFARVSSEIRICAEVIGKIASDLIILGSDPHSGIGELRLAPIQPGSSIMPGKVNPVLAIMMKQVAFAIAGNDVTVALGAAHGQLEINHFEPIIALRLFDSIELLTSSACIFTQKCISRIDVDRERSLRNLMQSSALATVFLPTLGYAAVSKLVLAAEAQGRPFIELAIEEGLLTESDALLLLHESTRYPEEGSAKPPFDVQDNCGRADKLTSTIGK